MLLMGAATQYSWILRMAKGVEHQRPLNRFYVIGPSRVPSRNTSIDSSMMWGAFSREEDVEFRIIESMREADASESDCMTGWYSHCQVLPPDTSRVDRLLA